MRGPETERSHVKRLHTGIYNSWGMFPSVVQKIGLDIGYKGSLPWAEPVLPNAIGIDSDYPKYNGIHLPFATDSQDYVFSSHCLEHILPYTDCIREWHRVTKVGGRIIIIVPHQFIYEKKANLPSKWNEGHHRFYTPSSLMGEIEDSLEPNTYRLRHLMDHDEGNDYHIPPNKHSSGAYEIECVIQKIEQPEWSKRWNG